MPNHKRLPIFAFLLLASLLIGVKVAKAQSTRLAEYLNSATSTSVHAGQLPKKCN
ncbi:MAG: hypothetical protein ACNYPI_03305 [Arenicellales bacterium WSBS_2016_MAG_OTU3]